MGDGPASEPRAKLATRARAEFVYARRSARAIYRP